MITISPEQPEDAGAIEALLDVAFGATAWRRRPTATAMA